MLRDHSEGVTLLSAVHNEINAFKKALTTLNERTSRKSGKVAAVYNNSTPKVGYKKLPSSSIGSSDKKLKDLYRTQLSFLRSADNQNETQRKLAKSALHFWETAKEVEANRVKSISKALETYQAGYVKCYGESILVLQSIEHITKAYS